MGVSNTVRKKKRRKHPLVASFVLFLQSTFWAGSRVHTLAVSVLPKIITSRYDIRASDLRIIFQELIKYSSRYKVCIDTYD